MTLPTRAFGAPSNHEYTYIHNNRQNIKVQQDTMDNIDHNYPKKGIMNEHAHQWLAGRW